MDFQSQVHTRHHLLHWLVLILGGTLLVAWLVYTPAGLLGKADAIGYAVCHRIDARSFHLGDRQIPLCARCTGMFLGVAVGVLYQLKIGRRGGMPPSRWIAFFVLLAAAWAVDGINSYFHLIPNTPRLYQPQNWLRLATGSGMGIVLSAFLVPAFHQTAWKTWDSRPALGTWKSVAGLVALTVAIDLLVLTENPLLLYPLALASAAGVITILVLVYTMVWMMIFKSENSFQRWSQMRFTLVGGATIMLLQIAAFDTIRFLLTGTWGGFQL